MSLPGGFLGGAQDRLLPASIPFRFFLSAAVFHVLAWAALFLDADEVAGFRGGTGLTLATIHLATLGTFAMTAIGASYQLLPVITRRALTRTWPTRASFWLLFPGICVLTLGMAQSWQMPMQIGAILVTCGLGIFLVLTADNLRRATSTPVVSAHGWVALASLAGTVALGLLLVWDFATGLMEDHATWGVIHMMLAAFGFMGLLVFGFSLILLPMFALSRSLPNAPGWAQLALSVAAFAGFTAGGLLLLPALSAISVAVGIAAVGCYLWLMHRILATRMRKRLGLSFVLIRVSWGFLILSLLLTGALMLDLGIPNAPALTGFVILAGWLLTFLLGVLQRIMPFLASMHAAGKSGLPPLLSDLTSDGPLKTHMVCHIAALALCGVGILLEATILIQFGALIGVVGAVAFFIFAIHVLVKLKGR